MSVTISRVGSDLRGARERLGYTLPAIAAHLRIRLPFLEAIEDGRIADLPGNAYALGFIRTYAQALGLDPDEIARRFKAEAAEVNRKTDLDFPAPVPERGIPAGALVLLGVVIAVGAYIGWYRMSGRDQPEARNIPAVPERLAALAGHQQPAAANGGGVISPNPSAAAPSAASNSPPSSAPPGPQRSNTSAQAASIQSTQAAPSPGGATAAPLAGASIAKPGSLSTSPGPNAANPPPTVFASNNAGAAPAPGLAPAPPAGDPSHMMLRAKSDAWIQVREKGGAVLLNRVLRSGETWVVPVAKSQLLMTTGNAAGTELLVDGIVTASLGGDGAVRRDLPLDPDLARDGKLAPAGAAGSGATSVSTVRPAAPSVTKTN